MSRKAGLTQELVSEMAALAMEYAFDDLDAPFKRVGAQDVPLPYAKNLEQLALPQVETIIKAVQETVYRKQK